MDALTFRYFQCEPGSLWFAFEILGGAADLNTEWAVSGSVVHCEFNVKVGGLRIHIRTQEHPVNCHRSMLFEIDAVPDPTGVIGLADRIPSTARTAVVVVEYTLDKALA